MASSHDDKDDTTSQRKKTRRQHYKDFIKSEVERRVKVEMEKMQARMDEQMRTVQEHMRAMQEQISQMNPPSQPPVYGAERQPSPQFSAADSCTVSHDLFSMSIGSSMMCQLAIEDPNGQKVMVAHEKVFVVDESALLHGNPLGQGNVKVSILTLILPNVLLPFPLPNSDISTVGEAVGSFIAWPRRLVMTGRILKKNKEKKVAQYPTKESLSTKESSVDPKA